MYVSSRVWCMCLSVFCLRLFVPECLCVSECFCLCLCVSECVCMYQCVPSVCVSECFCSISTFPELRNQPVQFMSACTVPERFHLIPWIIPEYIDDKTLQLIERVVLFRR